jgi:hypothetical protein
VVAIDWEQFGIGPVGAELGQPEPGDHLDRLNRLADIVAEACGTS